MDIAMRAKIRELPPLWQQALTNASMVHGVSLASLVDAGLDRRGSQVVLKEALAAAASVQRSCPTLFVQLAKEWPWSCNFCHNVMDRSVLSVCAGCRVLGCQACVPRGFCAACVAKQQEKQRQAQAEGVARAARVKEAGL